MGENTKIEWTDHTFNPWIGCTKISPGCLNCYAKTADDRHLMGPESHWGPGATRHRTSEDNWRLPVRWALAAAKAGKRAKVFCASQADVFDPEAPEGAQHDLFALIRATCDWLDWQLVTKRPEKIPETLDKCGLWRSFFGDTRCWLITSTETQAYAALRIPALLRIPAAVHGISAEPLLGELDLTKLPLHCPLTEGNTFNALTGDTHDRNGKMNGFFTGGGLGWIITGGESGRGSRECRISNIRSIVNQGAAAGVPVFVKQLGGNILDEDQKEIQRLVNVSVHHPKGGNPEEWLHDLRVRQFPVPR